MDANNNKDKTNLHIRHRTKGGLYQSIEKRKKEILCQERTITGKFSKLSKSSVLYRKNVVGNSSRKLKLRPF